MSADTPPHADRDPDLRDLAGGTELAVYSIDRDGHITGWSDGAARVFGYAPQEILGRNRAVLLAPEDVATGIADRLLVTTLGEGRASDLGWRVRKDGSRFLAETVASAIRDASGDLRELTVIARERGASDPRAARQAAADESEFRRLVGSVRDYAIFRLDRNGRIETWNAGAENIKGYTAGEILGRPVSVFYPPEELLRGKPWTLLDQASANGRVEDIGWRVRKDGTRFWADVVITALRDQNGTLVGYGKVVRDLTDRRHAEDALRASEERFRLLLESVKEYAIFMLDREGRVQTWSPAAARIMGYAADEVVGRPFSMFYTDEERRTGKAGRELEEAARTGRFEEEGWRQRKDGSRFWADVVLSSIHDSAGSLVGYAKVVRDLTERRRAEEERIRLAQAQEALRLRDEFVSIASHELKTPLTAMQLQVENLRRRLDSIDGTVAQRIDQLSRSGERMSNLIEMLLDVSRIASGRFELHPERFDLAEAVHEVGDRMGETAARARCTLTVRAPRAVVGTWDRMRIEQVVMNLLSNSIKYAAGTSIEVTLEREGDVAQLTVRDHGPGIAVADIDRIFGRFERSASIRNFGGLGLGLYLARQIVSAHDGTIAARNAADGGAIFTVRLPIEVAPIDQPGIDAIH